MSEDAVSRLIDLLLSFIPGAGTSLMPTLGLASASHYFGFTETGPDFDPCNPPPKPPSLLPPPYPGEKIYLVPAAINACQQKLRDSIVQNWLDGNSPLTAEQVYIRARTLIPDGDSGAALLICHNVVRAFARGSHAVYWQRVEDWLCEKRFVNPAFAIAPQTFVAPISDGSTKPLRGRWVGDNLSFGGPPLADANGLPTAEAVPQPLDYTDGAGHFYRPAIVNPGAGGQIFRLGKHNRDSIFGLLFDPRESLGTPDPGDWYQFFLTAAAAYYAVEKRAVLALDETFSYEFWKGQDVVPIILGRILQAFMEGVERYEGRDDVTLAEMDPVRLGWLWANALSFIEGGLYGSGSLIAIGSEAQVDANRESLAHREGALFGLGLSLGGKKKVPTWTWYIPRVNALLQVAVTKYMGLSLAGDVLGDAHPIEMATRGIKDIAPLVYKHRNELEPLITDLARQGPGLSDITGLRDIKEFPNVPVP